jgi:predicted dehydrogenase
MGRNHLRVVNSLPDLELTCATDTNRETLETACQQYDIQRCSSIEEMVDQVDAVMISTPTESHYPIGRFFLEKGKDLLVEKPFTKTIQEADELIELANQKKLTIGVGHLERFNPAVEYIEGKVTKPLFIEVQRLGSFSPRSLDVDVIMDLMIHDIDIVLHWDHSPIQEIHASGVPIISNKIDIANVRLKFESGLVANITASRVSQQKTRKLRIFQKNNYISLDYQKKRVKMYSIKGKEISEDIPEIVEVEPLANLWNNFYKTVTSGKNYNVTAGDARSALDVAIKISESIEIPSVND